MWVNTTENILEVAGALRAGGLITGLVELTRPLVNKAKDASSA